MPMEHFVNVLFSSAKPEIERVNTNFGHIFMRKFLKYSKKLFCYKNSEMVCERTQLKIFQIVFPEVIQSNGKNGHILPTGQWYAPSAIKMMH